jgi:hypothetical protein
MSVCLGRIPRTIASISCTRLWIWAPACISARRMWSILRNWLRTSLHSAVWVVQEFSSGRGRRSGQCGHRQIRLRPGQTISISTYGWARYHLAPPTVRRHVVIRRSRRPSAEMHATRFRHFRIRTWGPATRFRKRSAVVRPSARSTRADARQPDSPHVSAIRLRPEPTAPRPAY